MSRPVILKGGRVYMHVYTTQEMKAWLSKYCHDQSIKHGRTISQGYVVRRLLKKLQDGELK